MVHGLAIPHVHTAFHTTQLQPLQYVVPPNVVGAAVLAAGLFLADQATAVQTKL